MEIVKSDKRYASRKFILAAVLILIGAAVWILCGKFEFLPTVTTDQWIEYSKWILGLYMAGNVSDGAVEKLFTNRVSAQ